MVSWIWVVAVLDALHVLGNADKLVQVGSSHKVELACHLLQSELLEPWKESKYACNTRARSAHRDEHSSYENRDIERGRHGGRLQTSE